LLQTIKKQLLTTLNKDLFQKDPLLEVTDCNHLSLWMAASNYFFHKPIVIRVIFFNHWRTNMNTRSVSWLFSVIFIAVGILGFTPNVIVGSEGVFQTNAVHNLVHIVTGIAILVAIIKYHGYEGRVLKIVGTSYVVVTIVGFLTTGNMMLGMVHINEADRWLHLGLAIVILGAGFLPAKNKVRFNEDAIAS
jgi:hypothetical protein